MNDNNFLVIGNLKSINPLRDVVELEKFDKQTIRESTSIEENPQRETNIIAGLIDMFEDIEGICDNKVMDKYDIFIDEIVDNIKSFYGYKNINIKSFCIIRLKAGSRIYPHRDDDAISMKSYYDICRRIHIPVITNNKVIFNINGERKNLKYGEITEIDNLSEHSVVNNGDTDRIHILIDFIGEKNYYNKDMQDVPKYFYTN